jgi:hypothetical protein
MLQRVLARQVILFKRDPTLTRARIVQVIVVGLVIGGLWFDLDVTPQNARCAFQSCGHAAERKLE